MLTTDTEESDETQNGAENSIPPEGEIQEDEEGTPADVADTVDEGASASGSDGNGKGKS